MMFGARPRPLWHRPALRDYRRIFEAMPDAVLVLRSDAPRFSIEAATDAYLRATLTTREGHQAIIGRGLFEVFPPAPGEGGFVGVRNLRASLERVIDTGAAETMATQQYDIRRPDGSWEERHWSPVNVPLLDGRGAVEFIIHEVVDVTALMRLDRRAADAEHASAVAQEANAVKSRFLAAMSHELRTPLNAIGGYVDLITMGIHGPVTDAQRDALQRIRQSEHHLESLINQVLSYAKIESGHLHLERRAVALGEIVDEVLTLVEPQAAAKRLHLAKGSTAVDGCELAIVGDEDKVRQVLLNLVSNAVKFTPEGGQVDIECDADKTFVWVTVRDTGIGISEEDLGRIFEPFVQVGTKESASQGTGLGLSISRELARAMGGDVTARSRTGQGSSFVLRLPRFIARRKERRSA